MKKYNEKKIVKKGTENLEKQKAAIEFLISIQDVYKDI